MEVLRETPIESGPLAGHGLRLRHLEDPRYAGELEKIARSRPRSLNATRAKVFAQFVLAERQVLALDLAPPSQVPSALALQHRHPLVPCCEGAAFVPPPRPSTLPPPDMTPAYPVGSFYYTASGIWHAVMDAFEFFLRLCVPKAVVLWLWILLMAFCVQALRYPWQTIQIVAAAVGNVPSLLFHCLTVVADSVWAPPTGGSSYVSCPPCSQTPGVPANPPPAWDPTVIFTSFAALFLGRTMGMGGNP